MTSIELDRIDKQLMQLLQSDCTRSLQELADAVNLTTTPCWKRIRRLETTGVIRQRVALLDSGKLGLGLTAMVQLKTRDHSEAWYTRFVALIQSYPEVQEFYRMAGDYDYFLKVVVEDIAAFDQFYKRLVNSIEGLTDITSRFAMEQIKYTTELPVA